MAVPEYRDEVSITLSIADPPPSFSFPSRRIFLSKKNPTIEIGRTSKRNGAFEAAKSNAWFDSPVMSRKHALFTLDADKQKLYVKDTGSLHGTYKNDVRLETNVNHEVASGDKLKFGAFIERPQDKHYPCAMIVRQTYGSINPDLRGNSFRVPEDSDIESLISDEDQVNNSYEILRTNKFVTARMATSSCGHGPIDLTTDDHCPFSNIRDGTEAFDNSPHILEIPSPKLPEPVSVSGHEFSDLEEEPEGEGNDLSPNSMDTDDSYGGISEDCQSIDYAMSSVAGDSIVDEEEDFAEHDEFEEEQVHTQEPAPQGNGRFEEATIMASVLSEKPEKTPAQSLANSLSTQTRDVPQQLDSANLIQLDKRYYTWKSDLAPMTSINGTSSLKLPPISEAVFDTYNHETITHSTAEVVGRKHGKYEFFAARDANAAAARAQPQPRPIDPVRQAPVQEHRLLRAEMENKTQVQPADEVQKAPDEVEPRASDLVSSGLRYLATPPEHVETTTTSVEPELDDSSAWAFQESKKSFGAEATTEKVVAQENDADVVGDGDAKTAEALEAAELVKPVEALEPAKPVEAAKAAEPVKIPVPESTATKRKAEEISQLTPEEEQMSNDRQSRRQAHRRSRIQSTARPRHTAALGPPPTKRLRRMAEAVGYVALGGAAVMSVLIATAPAL
ncbi:Sarcolemmal membrane-associated protein [Fusarium oxysporum f. sp. rapae]|uniref:Sarcolemmal membrane-associated protein n=1 Tax=Fusarium oxysporum f. sp. rapae TaxID=485398 RepID=A0A8J5TTF1_FUSOX|nr:Sarcolemmal membrane-associated protein [Fusarium oxysporum f. sp. rapae]